MRWLCGVAKQSQSITATVRQTVLPVQLARCGFSFGAEHTRRYRERCRWGGTAKPEDDWTRCRRRRRAGGLGWNMASQRVRGRCDNTRVRAVHAKRVLLVIRMEAEGNSYISQPGGVRRATHGGTNQRANADLLGRTTDGQLSCFSIDIKQCDGTGNNPVEYLHL